MPTRLHCSISARSADGVKMRRGLYVAKHRGSACTDEIAFYTIDDQGLRLE